MFKSPTAVLAAILLAPVAGIAQTVPAFDVARVSKDVQILSSDAYEGRSPATAAETKTVAYIISRMKAAGLHPGGPLEGKARSWTQDVPLLKSDIVGALKRPGFPGGSYL
jgi:hypothetical protein